MTGAHDDAAAHESFEKGKAMAMAPDYQQRVVAERDALHLKLVALSKFISSDPIFPKLDHDERERLERQRAVMTEYLSLLDARIAAFNGPAPAT